MESVHQRIPKPYNKFFGAMSLNQYNFLAQDESNLSQFDSKKLASVRLDNSFDQLILEDC